MQITNSLTLYPASSAGLSTYNRYTWATTSYSGNYVHFKTNQQLSTYIMTRVEAVGINYAAGSPIRCAWTWYTYSYLVSHSSATLYSGLTADGQYMSTDGYVVFRGYNASSIGDTSLTLNIICANPTGYGANVQITAVNQNSNTGNYY